MDNFIANMKNGLPADFLSILWQASIAAPRGIQ